MIQYGCRYLRHSYEQKGDKAAVAKVDPLFNSMKDARKLFRLFKSLKELAKIAELLSKSGTATDELIFGIAARLAFLLYWLYDNLAILNKLKLVNMEKDALAKNGSTFWFLGLIATLIPTIMKLFRLLSQDVKA